MLKDRIDRLKEIASGASSHARQLPVEDVRFLLDELGRHASTDLRFGVEYDMPPDLYKFMQEYVDACSYTIPEDEPDDCSETNSQQCEPGPVELFRSAKRLADLFGKDDPERFRVIADVANAYLRLTKAAEDDDKLITIDWLDETFPHPSPSYRLREHETHHKWVIDRFEGAFSTRGLRVYDHNACHIGYFRTRGDLRTLLRALEAGKGK